MSQSSCDPIMSDSKKVPGLTLWLSRFLPSRFRVQSIRRGLRPLNSAGDDGGAGVFLIDAGFLQVVVVIARVGGDFPVIDVEDFGGDAADEVHVMANENQGAFE